ncbi:MAG: valine--tRNA ligase [Planctomycetes bacterium]|nr:valine--tRNA ligase [Planctomycetota bacterium]
MATTDLHSLPTQYDHDAAQKRWYSFWESRGYFHADAADPRPAYAIVIPPPNVTGALHLGHALNNTLQDILIRQKRMQGFNTLWMPGTDHAGIATQAVVERRLLEEEKTSRHALGREGLVQRIWKWKEQYEARILGQLKQLGCSCDWQRTRFTLDEVCARAVRETFFRLFQDGKIYRGKRLVNWDTFLQTAVSDDEVFHEPVKGHFWHFKYPVVNPRPGEPTHVTIATTRPETMLGDTAVAVHPDPAAAFDKAETELRAKLTVAPAKERSEIEAQIADLSIRRNAKLQELSVLRDMAKRGVQLELPLTGRTLPLVADEWAKPELGSGCVKITPAHDANDYEVWQRHSEIGAINILHPDGTLNDNVPLKYRGLTVKKAREAVAADMEAARLYNPETDREDREIDLAHSDRSKTPIEPYLADQWFVKMDELAQSAMDAVSDGRVTIVPERYAKGYLDWLTEKRDWPIGRQLWWGHRIPVWIVVARSTERFLSALPAFLEMYGVTTDEISTSHDEKDDRRGRLKICTRSETSDEALKALREFKQCETWPHPDVIGNPELEQLCLTFRSCIYSIDQESDVLDTWFSSALWPHSTLGWPEKTPELNKFYPTNILITSRDIITLWVARMVLTGLYNMGDVPFREVYIHPKILDGYGETMSKSKGNGIDPLDVINKFGVDALRFGLAHLTTETQDVRMPVEFECPHCQGLVNQTKQNRQLPRVKCDKCGKEFSTQWADKAEDKALPRGAVVSERFELGRNFCNKLWNASRFSLMNLEGYEPGQVVEQDLLIEDRWLLSRLATVTQQVTDALEIYRFADAARTLYDFSWNDFCSFYIEMTKARFAVPEQRPAAQRMLANSLDVLLRLLHPMIPFLTEEVWQLLAEAAPLRGLSKPANAAESICIAPWPQADASRQDATIEEQFADFQAVLGVVREIRNHQNISLKEDLTFTVRCDEHAADLLRPMQPYFSKMARATGTAWGPEATAPDISASVTLSSQTGPMEVHVDVSRFIDVAAERKRLEKQRDDAVKFVESIDKKLSNKSFVDKAPADVVQQQRDKLAELKGQLASVAASLAKLPK